MKRNKIIGLIAAMLTSIYIIVVCALVIVGGVF